MALASPPSTSPSSNTLTHIPSNQAPSTTFDIVSHYTNLTSTDTTLPPPIAAIESLIALLSHTPLTTVSETLALLSHQSHVLLRSQLNPIPVSAGTDLFQRYLISAFQQRSSLSDPADFSSLRSKLVSNSKLFVSRAKTASTKISQHFLPFIPDEATIFTYSLTPLNAAIITKAVVAGRYFTLINLTTPSMPTTSTHPGIPSSTIPFHALTAALSTLSPFQKLATSLLIPCHAVLENGSLIAPLGTHAAALIVSSFNLPVYVPVESFKFVRSFPLGSGEAELDRLGVKQNVLRLEGGVGDERAKEEKVIEKEEDMVEIVPPGLITALVTENGVMTPSAVSEELINLWF